jgi:hypothetical protein
MEEVDATMQSKNVMKRAVDFAAFEKLMLCPEWLSRAG